MIPKRYLRPGAPTAALCEDFTRIREEHHVSVGFPPAVDAAAAEAARTVPSGDGREDLTGIDFLTIDPPGSRDLDQAMHLERRDGGFRVRYAIADVGALIPLGSEVDAEAWRRGQTIYCPDVRALLYPASISEGAASLLPGELRAAIVFTIDLDDTGERTAATVGRALVESRRQLAYGEADVPHLEEIGRLRQALARRRGAIRLEAPAQEVVPDPSTPYGFRVEFEPRRPVEDWNAEISLLAGMVAAELMARSGLCLLRTMGGADPYRIDRLRRSAAALGVDWPASEPFAEFVDRLDPSAPREAALLQEAHGVMGHAGYAVVHGRPAPSQMHAGIGAFYAHTTAPLRRLQDRFVLDLLVGDGDRQRIERLPDVMAESASRASQVERAVIDATEVRLLEHRVGEVFTAVPLEVGPRGTLLQIAEPPIKARLHDTPAPPLGQPLAVRLTRADPRARALEFHRV